MALVGIRTRSCIKLKGWSFDQLFIVLIISRITRAAKPTGLRSVPYTVCMSRHRLSLRRLRQPKHVNSSSTSAISYGNHLACRLERIRSNADFKHGPHGYLQGGSNRSAETWQSFHAVVRTTCHSETTVFTQTNSQLTELARLVFKHLG